MPRNPNAERDNPCLKEQALSYKCLDKNAYDREKCEIFFKNYKNCKDFWDKVKTDRRRQGLYPNLPPVEERAAIKQSYMKSKPEL